MHPLLSNPQRVAWYLAGWLLLSLPWIRLAHTSLQFSVWAAAVLVIPVMLITGIICSSAYYLCKAMPSNRRSLGQTLMAFGLSSAVSALLVMALISAWHQALVLLAGTEFQWQWQEHQSWLLGGSAAILFLLNLLAYDVFLSFEQVRISEQAATAAQLAARIRQQFPVALIDEFQDTSPDQYMIFDALYAIAENRSDTGVFLIGDPKQAIYGFRGADIRSYLTARSATAGRHYVLDTNFRSVAAVVDAVNHVFMLAENPESGQSGGAFCFRRGDDNPLPFEPVKAKGRAEKLVRGEADIPGLQWMLPQNTELKEAHFRRELAQQCAEHMVQLLNDAECGFRSDDAFRSLRPADMAVLVRNRYEAAEIRAALSQRGVASVYLSDKDSIFQTPQARDVLYWLQAVADPLAAGKARAALATRSACRHWDELQRYAEDDYAWEQQAEQLRQWQQIWRRQGVLAMIRQMIHGLSLGSRLLTEQDGERRLTDLLHLAELLQQASVQLEGEQALIRWLEEQIHDPGEADEHVLRLESDAELVQVITIHKSKGLEYPLVFLPFIAAGMRKNPDAKAAFYQLPEEGGQTRLDFAKSKESSLRQIGRAHV